MSEPDEKVVLHLAKPDTKSLIALYEKLSGKKATPEMVKELEAALRGKVDGS
jgi:hypothetical protein